PNLDGPYVGNEPLACVAKPIRIGLESKPITFSEAALFRKGLRVDQELSSRDTRQASLFSLALDDGLVHVEVEGVLQEKVQGRKNDDQTSKRCQHPAQGGCRVVEDDAKEQRLGRDR